MPVAEVLVPLRLILGKSAVASYKDISDLLNEEKIDSQCLRKALLYLIRDVMLEEKYIDDDELKAVNELIDKMSSVYECTDPSTMGLVISPNPGVKAINDKGERVIDIMKKNVKEALREYVEFSIAPVTVKNPKSSEGMVISLAYAFNAFPIAVELINGPVVRIKYELKEDEVGES